MHKISLKSILLLVSLSISAGLTFAHNSQTVATTVKSSGLSSQSLQAKKANNDLVTKNLQQYKSLNSKANGIKLSSRQLFGSWSVTGTDNSGNKYIDTIIYSPDGTYIHIYTLNNGHWFIKAQGTWRVSNNILYENPRSGEKLKGSVKFTSNNEFLYQSEKGITKWQKVNINRNLSANQLLGTWSIKEKSIYYRPMSTLIKFNSDGTFFYSEKEIIGSYLTEQKKSGTWQYLNIGYADGFLLLKDSQEKLIYMSSINWSSNGSFLNIHRSQYNPGKETYSKGKKEEFRRTKVKI